MRRINIYIIPDQKRRGWGRGGGAPGHFFPSFYPQIETDFTSPLSTVPTLGSCQAITHSSLGCSSTTFLVNIQSLSLLSVNTVLPKENLLSSLLLKKIKKNCSAKNWLQFPALKGRQGWRMGWKVPRFLGAVTMSVIEFLGGARNTLVTLHYKITRNHTQKPLYKSMVQSQ